MPECGSDNMIHECTYVRPLKTWGGVNSGNSGQVNYYYIVITILYTIQLFIFIKYIFSFAANKEASNQKLGTGAAHLYQGEKYKKEQCLIKNQTFKAETDSRFQKIQDIPKQSW